MFEITLDVLRTIGIPSFVEGNNHLNVTPEHLCIASLNKLKLFYLETLLKFGKIDVENVELVKLRNQHKKILELSVFLGKLFENNNVTYSIMKTLRPFAYVGADVDVLLNNRADFSKILKKLREHNFTFVGPSDLFTATLTRKDFQVNVDLQLEVTVSSLPYINKKFLLQNVIQRKVDSSLVKTLNSQAEVVTVACHALYKEHMYTLADFFSTALSVTSENVEVLCQLAESSKSVVAVAAMLIWTQRIANVAFGIRLSALDDALDVLGTNTLESMLNRAKVTSPMKFSLPLVFLSLLHKISSDNYTRSSLLAAVSKSFSQKQVDAFAHHFGRESY